MRTVDGTALGEQIDDAEISECELVAKAPRDQVDRRDDRQDYLVIPPPEARAVDGCRIEHVLRHRSEPGYEDHHPEREQPPSMDDGDGDHRQILLAQPLPATRG